MVQLAPHLVRPLPLVVPAFGGERPDRLVGVGLNLYDVMSIDRLRRRPQRGRRVRRRAWAPDRHRVIPGDEVVERLPALAGRDPSSGYLFYDCQTDDSRLVLTVLAEAERYGAVCANGLRGDRPRRRGRPHPRASAPATSPRGRSSSSRPPTSSTRPACGPTACAPRSSTTRRRSRASGRAAARTSRCPTTGCRSSPGPSSRPAAGARSSRCRGSARTLIGTTDNDYDAEDLDHIRPADSDVEYLLEADERLLRHRPDLRRHRRRLRGRPAADLDRRPEEVGRHLAQGRALRDLERDDHDHRRQAHDVAADGEDGRRPPRRARGARRALPHPRDPARPGRRPGRPAPRRGRPRGRLRPPRRPLRPHRAGRPGRRGGARRARAADRRGRPARPAGRGRARRAARAGARRSATRCCAARAWPSWPPAP